MIVRGNASDGDIAMVLYRMREHCRREMLLTRDSDDVDALYAELCALKRHAVLRNALIPPGHQEPAAIFIAYRASTHVAMFQTFSTDDWHLVARPFIRWFNEVIALSLRLAGVRLAEFNVLAEPEPNLRWFGLMNAVPWGGPLPRGRNGELYQPMVWMPGGARPGRAQSSDPGANRASPERETVDASAGGLVSTITGAG